MPACSIPRSSPPAPVKNDNATGSSAVFFPSWFFGMGARFCLRIHFSTASRSNTRRAPH